jgi:hypothetical protein
LLCRQARIPFPAAPLLFLKEVQEAGAIPTTWLEKILTIKVEINPKPEPKRATSSLDDISMAEVGSNDTIKTWSQTSKHSRNEPSSSKTPSKRQFLDAVVITSRRKSAAKPAAIIAEPNTLRSEGEGGEAEVDLKDVAVNEDEPVEERVPYAKGLVHLLVDSLLSKVLIVF